MFLGWIVYDLFIIERTLFRHDYRALCTVVHSCEAVDNAIFKAFGNMIWECLVKSSYKLF